MSPKNLYTVRVKSADDRGWRPFLAPLWLALGANQGTNPLPHLLRSLVGKSHRQNAFRLSAVANEIRDPKGHDARFPRSGAGEYQHRTPERLYSFKLFWVQSMSHAWNRIAAFRIDKGGRFGVAKSAEDSRIQGLLRD